MAEAGKYRRRVSLINNVQNKDISGSWYSTPVTVISCWAYRDKLSSQHAFVQYANSYGSSFKYEIYYNSGVVIDSNMILRDDGKDYKITSIIVTGDKKVKWELICTLKDNS